MHAYILNHLRLLQPRQNYLNPIHLIRRELSVFILLDNLLERPAPEAYYYILIVACRASLVNIVDVNDRLSTNPEEA